MVNYILNLGTETSVHGQLHTKSVHRDCCSWTITGLIWALRLLTMVNCTLNMGTTAVVHG